MVYHQQFSDSDKVCAENAGIDYMDVIQFVGKDLDLNYVLSKEHTSEGIVILNNDHISLKIHMELILI